MKPPLHLLRLDADTTRPEAESVQLVTRTDIQWGTPIFRAPVLPTAHQLNRELPFTVNFRPQFRPRT